ncbi:MAG: hypothetical protein BGO70_09300 [Bacteroidetes bacterium 43-93]|nr:hypothetical protein [Bacteroidota bacterium]OJX00359.1 MAG: hypothetical protein BGO70_09300 [Bacteroidetes bacterium 43-93]
MPYYRIVSLEGKVISCRETAQMLPPKEHVIMFNPNKDHLVFALVKAQSEKEAKSTVKLLSKAR